MKQTKVPKTYRINTLSIKKIEDFAKKQNISQSHAIDMLIELATRYIEEKQLDQELTDLSKDEKWMNENVDWAELDLY